MALTEQFSEYASWKREGADAISRLRQWLTNNNIGDAQSDLRLQHLLTRLHEDRLTVAFVAEFSRGKSELINAIFFSEYGRRILPSSSGRTTMCPTELQWEDGQVAGVRLLPIATRMESKSLAELRNQTDQWVFEYIDVNDAKTVEKALTRVCETELVPREKAEAMGFAIDEKGNNGARPDENGMVEVARWRHAIIQYPHPLLKAGLVIVDTPGLNAIGSEPELTLSLLPSAHVIMFILAADTGVTQSDLSVWKNHVNIGGSQQKGRLVALNKIDSLWDGIRTEKAIEKEIDLQIKTVAQTLGITEKQVFPLSAQKALLARFNSDLPLLRQSRISGLEKALSTELLPSHKQILCENSRLETGEIINRSTELLRTRLNSIQEQLKELSDLRGKNQSVIEYMMRKVHADKEEFEIGLQRYYAVRSIFTTLSNKLFSHIGLETVRAQAMRAREVMDNATFSRDLRAAMAEFFNSLRAQLDQSANEVREISSMLENMYKRFSVEHGLTLAPPISFSVKEYEKNLSKIERACMDEISGVGAMLFSRKSKVTQRFFDVVTQEARRTFESANRDVERWLRTIMSPLETQVREYQLQLNRRMDSVKRVYDAAGTLEGRIMELEQSEDAIKRQLTDIARVQHGILQVFAQAGEAKAD